MYSGIQNRPARIRLAFRSGLGVESRFTAVESLTKPRYGQPTVSERSFRHPAADAEHISFTQ
ncbi:hypothetical protein C491_17082 [Natronococcus amylolyticus DSM 10524]|uniref:Uncharacterized protein n=1 Tax=Natronococcus amylolyticus DSM 10524 TaxID=1227497 RepID=L9X4D1_9EURY|nr:hypothetical protein C491_17082 [Natronococcus amylolyticus DSM 10524]